MTSSPQNGWRIGIDVGGTKIEGVLLTPEAEELVRYRVATPRNDYAATIAAIVDLGSKFMQERTCSSSASMSAKCQ
jgi:fructokinase